MPSVIFVCTANRFRSPLASAFFKKLLEDSFASGTWTVDSAGTWTSPGLPVLPGVSLIASKYGVDLVQHRSKPVSAAILSSGDLILVMEAGHKEALRIEFPLNRDRIYLLSQVVEGRSYNIPDMTDSIESMMGVGDDLHNLIQIGISRICDVAVKMENMRARTSSSR